MERDWTVLLIGGGSCTGKTYLARQLSARFHIPTIQVDDIRIAMQAIAKSGKYQDLYFFTNHLFKDIEKFDNEYIVEKAITLGRIIWPGVNAVIDNHLKHHKSPLIIEGDGILPELLATRSLNEIETIFLYDEKEEIYIRRLTRRLEGSKRQKQTYEWSKRYTEFAYMYGKRIREQAKKCGFYTMKSFPLNNLLSRAFQYTKKSP